MRGIPAGWRMVAALALLAGCGGSFDPPSLIVGLRLLAVRAEPPEVPPGGKTHLTAFAVEASGRPVTLDWAYCNDGRAQLGLSPECVLNDTAPYLLPLGTGPEIDATMPMVDPRTLGLPDQTDGLYFPLRLVGRSPVERVVGYYGLRYQLPLGLGGAPNHNPRLDTIYVLPADGSAAVPIVDGQPYAVPAGAKEVRLAATLAPGSEEKYSVFVGDPRAMQKQERTEVVRISWHATGGRLSQEVTGQMRPAPSKPCPGAMQSLCPTTLDLRTKIAAGQKTVDLAVVAIDDRGGMDFARRTLALP